VKLITILLIAAALLGGSTPTVAAPARVPAAAQAAPVASCWAGPPFVYRTGQPRCWRGVPFVLPSEVR
jgi:hypothetical protein